MNHEPHHRSIKSFVLRQGHLSIGQKKAIEENWNQVGIDFAPQRLNLNAVFQRDNPKILEIGFGMGTATAHIAQQLPDHDFLAIEVHTPGVGNLCKLIAEQNINNIKIMRHDAVEVVEQMLPDNSLQGIHIFFPDPWHKKRHNKRRLIQMPFMAQLLPKLKIGGYVHLATDWQEYAEQMLDVLRQFPQLTNTVQDYAPTPSYRPETKFEARGKRLGHGVWDLVFRKNDNQLNLNGE